MKQNVDLMWLEHAIVDSIFLGQSPGLLGRRNFLQVILAEVTGHLCTQLEKDLSLSSEERRLKLAVSDRLISPWKVMFNPVYGTFVNRDYWVLMKRQ